MPLPLTAEQYYRLVQSQLVPLRAAIASLQTGIQVIGTAAFDAGSGAVDNLVVRGVISDVIYVANGAYQVVFATPQPDTNYCAVVIPDAVQESVGFPKNMTVDEFKAHTSLFSGGGFIYTDFDYTRIVVIR